MAWTQYIYTPNGTPVWVIYQTELFTDHQIDSINTTIENAYPYAVRIGDATSTYNCHSYAWNMVEGGPTAWLNAGDNEMPNLSNYWTDGSYIETTETKAEKIY